MVSALDIYRSAKLLVDRHGDEAPIHAAMRADDVLDMEGLDRSANPELYGAREYAGRKSVALCPKASNSW